GGGSSTGNIQRDVYNSIKGNYEGLVNLTNQAYQNFRTAAKQENVNFDTSTLENSINNKIQTLQDAIDKNPRREDQYKPIISALNDYNDTIKGTTPSKQSPIVDESGTPFSTAASTTPKLNDFNDAERLRQDLNQDYEDAYNSRNFEFTRTVRSLKNDLDNAMTDSVSDNPNLQNMLLLARGLYKRQIPFREAVNQRGNEADTTFFNNYMAEKSGRTPNLDNFINENIKTGNNKDATDTLN